MLTSARMIVEWLVSAYFIWQTVLGCQNIVPRFAYCLSDDDDNDSEVDVPNAFSFNKIIVLKMLNVCEMYCIRAVV